MAFGDQAFQKQLNLIEAKQSKMNRLQPTKVKQFEYENDLNSLDQASFIQKYGSGAALDYQINDYHKSNKADNELHALGRNTSIGEDLLTGAAISLGDNLPKLGAGLGYLMSPEGSQTGDFFYEAMKEQEAQANATRREYSPETQAAIEAQQAEAEIRNKEFDKLEDPSLGDYGSDFLGAAGEYLTNPRSLVPLIGENTDSLVTMPVGGAVIGAGAKALVKKGASEAVKKKAATSAAAKAGLAYTGVSEGGHNAIQAINDIESMSHEELAESPEYVARKLKNPDKSPDQIKKELARDIGQEVAVKSGATAAVIGKLTGASEFMSTALLKKANKASKTAKKANKSFAGKVAGKTAKGFATESVEEVLQSGSGQAIGNIAAKRADPSRKTMEGVTDAAAAGALSGGATGGAVGAIGGVVTESGKAAGEVAKKSLQKRQDKREDKKKEKDEVSRGTTVINKWNKIETKNIEREVDSAIKSQDAQELSSAYLTLRERSTTEKNPKTKKLYENQINKIKEVALKAQTTDVSEKVKTAPVEDLNETEVSEAVAAVVSNPTAPYSADLSQRLTGSKKLTENQKTLLQESSKPDSIVRKVLNKSVEDVEKDLLWGGDGFTGLDEYVKIITSAVQSKDSDTALHALRRLEKLNNSHRKKARSGKSHQKQTLNPELRARITDESNAINTVFNGLNDTVIKAFPDYEEAVKSHNQRMSEKLGEIDPKYAVEPATTKSVKKENQNPDQELERTTVPTSKRVGIVGEALSGVLNPEADAADPEVSEFRRNLVQKAGLGDKSLPALRAAYSHYESLAKKSRLNKEETKTLRELKKTILQGYDALISSDVAETGKLQEVLTKQAGEDKTKTDNITSLFAPESVELVASQKQRGHTSEPRIKSDTIEKRTKYTKLHKLLNDFKDSLTDDQLKEFKDLPESFTDFSESVVEDYNALVNIINEARIHNSDVNVTTDNTRINTTTPNNRVFQNLLEKFPASSFVRKTFKYIQKRRLGLLHTENNIFKKLVTENEIQDHITANMSSETKADAVTLAKFVNDITKSVDKGLAFKDKRNQINTVYEHFIDSQTGKMDSRISNAIGVSLADWFHTNGMKTVRTNTNEMIAHNLGMTGDDAKQYQPTINEKIELKNAGITKNNFIVNVGRKVYQNLGYRLNDDAEIYLEEAFINNLGTLALVAAEQFNNESLLQTQYIHRFKYTRGKSTVRVVRLTDSHVTPDPPEFYKDKNLSPDGAPTPVIRAVSRVNQDKKTVLSTATEAVSKSMDNTSLVHDVLGIETSHVPVYMANESMPKSEVYQPYASPDEHKATNNQNNIQHILNQELFDLVMSFTDEQKIQLLDDLPEPGTEHKDNTKRNEDIRSTLLGEYQGAQNIKKRMDLSESETVRFRNKIAEVNRRMNQEGTDGNPVNSKLIRELFVPQDQKVTIDPKNKDQMFAFKLAVLHGIDDKTNVLDKDGNPLTIKKGIDKSTNAAVEVAWNNLLNNKVSIEAASSLDADKIFKAITREGIKAPGGGNSYMHKLHALQALGAYLKAENKPFTTLLGKEDDGIVNGTANLRMQLIGTISKEEWFNEVAKVGIYVIPEPGEEAKPKSFSEFTREPNNLDPYEAIAAVMKEVLNDLSNLPAVSATKSLFQTPANLKKHPKVYWDKELKGYYIKQSKDEYRITSNSLDFIINYSPESNLKNKVLEIARSFTKDPLMQYNYQAGLKTLKIGIAGQIEEGIKIGLEQINRIQDLEAKKAAIEVFELAVNTLSFMAPQNYVFKVADNPLETDITWQLRDMINFAVEATYGPALEEAFNRNYSHLREMTSHLVNISRLANSIYIGAFEKLEKEILENNSDQISLTVAQKKEIEKKLKPHSPSIAHALSEDRTIDGVKPGYKELSPNKDKDGNILNPKANTVKQEYKDRDGKVRSISSLTSSSKLADPGVSAAGVLIHAIDAAIQKLGMLRKESFTNIHDAKILNTLVSAELTKQTNKDFYDIHKDYSIFDATIEMLREMLKGEVIDDSIVDKAFKEIAKQNLSLLGTSSATKYLEHLELLNAFLQEDRKEYLSSGLVIHQYANSDNSGHVSPKTDYKRKEITIPGLEKKPEPEIGKREEISYVTKNNITVSKNLKWGKEIYKFVSSVTQKTGMTTNDITVLSLADAKKIAASSPETSELRKAVEANYKGGFYAIEPGKNQRAFIVVNDTRNKAPFFTVMAHELGHLFFYQKSKDLATAEEKAALWAEFNKVADQYSDRDRPLEEWMADKFAGWVVTNTDTDKKIYAPFFNKLRGLLKDFFEKAVKALPDNMAERILPSEVFNDFIETIVNRKDKPILNTKKTVKKITKTEAKTKTIDVPVTPVVLTNQEASKITESPYSKSNKSYLYKEYLEIIDDLTDPVKKKEYREFFEKYYLNEVNPQEITEKLDNIIDEINDVSFSSPVSEEQLFEDQATAIDKEINFDGSNAIEVFDSLDNYRQSAPEHKAHLKKMLTIISPAVERLRMLFRTENIDESYGFLQGSIIDLRVNTGAKANNLEMSAQELYVHETYHAFFRQIDAKKTKAWKKLKREYLRARKYLTVDDFLRGIENPTAADRTAAQKLMDHALYNDTFGGVDYDTALGERKKVPNADPIEEFAVLAATNEQVRNALRSLDTRLKIEDKTHASILEKVIEAFHELVQYFTDRVYKLQGIDGDERIVRLVEHLIATHQAPKSTLHRAMAATDSKIDAAGQWVSDKLSNTHTAKGLKMAYDSFGEDVITNIRNWVTDKEVGQNKLLTSLASEFALGRLGLARLTKLLTKSSYFIERKSQQIIEYVAAEVMGLLPEVTDEQSSQLYTGILESDAQSLLDHHDIDTAYELLSDSDKRIKRLNSLAQKLFKLNPSYGRFMKYHAEDLGYHMVTGQRLLEDGMYMNAMQIANLWGMENRTRKTKNVDDIIPVLDEMATLYAVGYSGYDKNIKDLFSKEKYGKKALHNLLLLQKETVDISASQGFEDNKYNMRKGYVREKVSSDIEVTIESKSQEETMAKLGYTLSYPVSSSADNKSVNRKGDAELHYYTKQGGQQTYLTGVLSTVNNSKKGNNLFVATDSMSELEAVKVKQNFEYMKRVKDSKILNTLNSRSKMPKVPASQRGAIAQPAFDSEGNVTDYRMILSNSLKDDMLNREKDIRKAIGYTLAGISRKRHSKSINTELVDYLHDTYKEEYEKFPNEFIEVSPRSEKDSYYLIPQDARNYAKDLFGSDTFYVRREQFDIAFGYRKFSVAQLQHDSHPTANAFREIQRLTNNLATLVFNNRIGITLESYHQAFIATAKDTLVIKSGVVTAGNIMSNVLLLWWSGVNLKDAIADHGIAYKATFDYNRDTKEIFRLNRRLQDKYLTENERKKILADRAILQQDVYNNPVRELIEAGLYQTIVDDVETSENVSEAKNKLDQMIEPIAKRTPGVLRDAGKVVLMTHDTKIYQVFRDVAQISDFAARYSLHKHNMNQGMAFEESLRDVRSTFVEYDIPQHKSLQYLNDMGVMGFTKWFFRMQQVFVKRFGEKPARSMMLILLQNMFSGMENPVKGVMTGFDGIANRFGIDWTSAIQKGAVINTMT